MRKYEITETTSWGEATQLSRKGWKLIGTRNIQNDVQSRIAGSPFTHEMKTVYIFRKRLPFIKIGRWSFILAVLLIAFSACSKDEIDPAGRLPGYHITSAAKWLKNGFPLDTSMMFYQHPAAPVKIQAPLIQCLTYGPCRPMDYNLYVPDSIYFKYYPQ